MEKNIKRIEWIDIAKGIGIILVVAGHISINTDINNFIYSFHMPLFFMISGYLYKTKKNHTKKKIKSILVPYIIFSLITFFYWFFIERHIREEGILPLNAFINIFLARGGDENYIFNVVMWFLPCLFITENIFNYILEKTNKINKKYSQIILIIIIFCFFIIGFLFLEKQGIRLPFCLDIVPISIVFYYIGFMMNTKIERKMKNNTKSNLIFIGILLLITVIFLSKIEKGANLNNLKINNYILFYITAILGSYMIYLISNNIKSKHIKWLGKNSLYIMCMHEPIKRIELTIVSILTGIDIELLRTNIISIIINTIIVIIICIAIMYMIKKIKEKGFSK